jgi:hypothetical protein
MAIFGRWAQPVTILRMGTLDDVRTLDGLEPDARDRENVRQRCYVVTEDVEDHSLSLMHIAYLRADGGDEEIERAIARLQGGVECPDRSTR